MNNDIEDLKDMFGEDDIPQRAVAPLAEHSVVVSKGREEDANTDYGYVRDGLYQLSELADQASEELYFAATSSGHPRAFEVLANMIKTRADVFKQLVDLNKEDFKPKKKVEPTEQTNVQNNFYAGSTHELFKQLKNINGDTDEQ